MKYLYTQIGLYHTNFIQVWQSCDLPEYRVLSRTKIQINISKMYYDFKVGGIKLARSNL